MSESRRKNRLKKKKEAIRSLGVLKNRAKKR